MCCTKGISLDGDCARATRALQNNLSWDLWLGWLLLASIGFSRLSSLLLSLCAFFLLCSCLLRNGPFRSGSLFICFYTRLLCFDLRLTCSMKMPSVRTSDALHGCDLQVSPLVTSPDQRIKTRI